VDLLIGLGIALVLWCVALLAIAWSWERHLPIAIAAGAEIDETLRQLTLAQVLWQNVRRHTLGWTAFFFIFFFLLALASFPAWQCLGIAVVLAIYYGSIRWRREAAGAAKAGSRGASLLGPSKDDVWYGCLAVAEWCGYLGLIVFGSQIVAEVF
jgi:hypothetical protein